LIELSSVNKYYVSKHLIKDFNLKIPEGQFLGLLGPSGCGKTTLIRMIAGLETYDSGNITYSTPPEIGYVFQDAQLLPWLSVLENVQLPLILKRSSSGVKFKKSEIYQEALEQLDQVNLSSSANLFPQMLSGGMKMRVSLARALIQKPNLLILDEPFSALDEIHRFQLQEKIHQLWQIYKFTAILVTHSNYEAAFLADRILQIGDQHGKIRRDLSFLVNEKRTSTYRESQEFLNILRILREELPS